MRELPDPIALPAWANPADFTEVRPGAFLLIQGRFAQRKVTFVYKGVRQRIVIGTEPPWKVLKLYLRKVDRGEVNPQAIRPDKPRTPRKRAAVTYEFLFSRMQLARRRAAKKGIPFALTTADLYAMGDAQHWRCALTNIPFDCTVYDPWNNPYTLAIDRIDSRGGYTLDNVRLVLHAINVALGPWGEDAFAHIAQRFLARRVPSVSRIRPETGTNGSTSAPSAEGKSEEV